MSDVAQSGAILSLGTTDNSVVGGCPQHGGVCAILGLDPVGASRTPQL